ncbi:hypothetical protein D9M68_821070 [compost metagenome]
MVLLTCLGFAARLLCALAGGGSAISTAGLREGFDGFAGLVVDFAHPCLLAVLRTAGGDTGKASSFTSQVKPSRPSCSHTWRASAHSSGVIFGA